MKVFFTLFALLALVLAAYPFLDTSKSSQPLTGLPWQIEIMPDQSTRVFGLQIGYSRLSDAIAMLGDDMELAIIAAHHESGNLEMYYGHYRAGLLSGKLVLQTQIDEKKIKRWRENAVTTKYMASGQAKKYFINENDLEEVLNERIIGLTFIPAINLDDEVIVARFGEPQSRIQVGGDTHYLYPNTGLDLVFNAQAKEILQYVSPANFHQLVQPLQPR